MKALRRLLLGLLLVAPALGAAVWTCWPSLQAYVAMRRLTVPKMSEQDWGESQKTIEVRRRVQRHFLSHNVYIPLEDIVVTAPSETASNELALLMQKACGRGRLYVWIPLKFRMPITGEKVIEWCWKPQASSST